MENDAQLIMASTAALVLGSPPPRRMTGCAFFAKEGAGFMPLASCRFFDGAGKWAETHRVPSICADDSVCGSPNEWDVVGRERKGAICELRLPCLWNGRARVSEAGHGD